jgi:hypothetical protein
LGKSTWHDTFYTAGLKEFNGPGFQFKVHDRGKGKEESEGSLFQWQDLLHNQCMLLSLKTNRYIGMIPGTGEPYSADCLTSAKVAPRQTYSDETALSGSCLG